MPLTLSWTEVLLRLGLSMAAGAVIGLNRQERAQPAGLRTTILVCLAASAAMIQVNLLLVMAHEKQSLVSLDLMRLPLGILSGMGFIGGGAILRRGDHVRGVTTAATLWYATVMGLCFGGGQLTLGLALLGLGAFVLWVLKVAENRFLADRRGTLTVTLDAEGPTEEGLRRILLEAGFDMTNTVAGFGARLQRRSLRCQVRPRKGARTANGRTPDFVERLAKSRGILRVTWTPR